MSKSARSNQSLFALRIASRAVSRRLYGVACALDDGFGALEDGLIIVNDEHGILLDGITCLPLLAKNPPMSNEDVIVLRRLAVCILVCDLPCIA